MTTSIETFEMRKASFYVWLRCAFIAACFAAAMAIMNCCGSPPPSSVRAGVSRASLVTLMRRVPAQPMPQWSGASPSWGRMRDTFEPVCTAFAVRRHGATVLMTAAHCVFARRMRYMPPNGVGLGMATLQHRDEAHDIAFMTPEDSAGLQPLELAAMPTVGERVRAFSPMHGVSLGCVTASLGPWAFETDQTVVRGWSGSPEVDDEGRVVGLVVQCDARESDGQCVPGNATAMTVLP